MKAAILVALVAFASAIPTSRITSSSDVEASWQQYKAKFGRTYQDDEEIIRKNIFAKNLKMIEEHNAEAEEGKHTYTLGMNEFGDMTFEEFHSKYTGFLGPRNEYLRSKNLAPVPADDVELPTEVDWVKEGAVTKVKNQGQCGSCWAFSSTGAIEGANYIANKKLVSLSEQELMDCSSEEGNHSCNGGLMDYAFEWVMKNGICSEDSYPYRAYDESCRSCSSVVKISSFKDVGHTEKALMAAVAQQPVSVAIEADQASFQFYNGGVLTEACGTRLDHGVLAVGYGTLDGTAYWKVKNSWGSSWGMDGYVLLERGLSQSGGQCGILLAASYPVV